jgi:endonuclease V-like protein UPF0215 family
LTRSTIIHLKPYTRQEFKEIAVNVLNREEGIEKEVANVVAETVFDKLRANIRECVRIARLVGNDLTGVQLVASIFTEHIDQNNNQFMHWSRTS